MEILKLNYRELTIPQSPSREVVIIIIVILIVVAIILNNALFSFLLFFLLSITYFINLLPFKTLVYQKSSKTLSFLKWSKEVRKEQVIKMSFSWFNQVIITGTMYDPSGMKKSHRYRLHLLCELTLENGKVIRVLSQCPPWWGIPEGWPHKTVKIPNGEVVFKVSSKVLVDFKHLVEK